MQDISNTLANLNYTLGEEMQAIRHELHKYIRAMKRQAEQDMAIGAVCVIALMGATFLTGGAAAPEAGAEGAAIAGETEATSAEVLAEEELLPNPTGASGEIEDAPVESTFTQYKNWMIESAKQGLADNTDTFSAQGLSSAQDLYVKMESINYATSLLGLSLDRDGKGDWEALSPEEIKRMWLRAKSNSTNLIRTLDVVISGRQPPDDADWDSMVERTIHSSCEPFYECCNGAVSGAAKDYASTLRQFGAYGKEYTATWRRFVDTARRMQTAMAQQLAAEQSHASFQAEAVDMQSEGAALRQSIERQDLSMASQLVNAFLSVSSMDRGICVDLDYEIGNGWNHNLASDKLTALCIGKWPLSLPTSDEYQSLLDGGISPQTLLDPLSMAADKLNAPLDTLSGRGGGEVKQAQVVVIGLDNTALFGQRTNSADRATDWEHCEVSTCSELLWNRRLAADGGGVGGIENQQGTVDHGLVAAPTDADGDAACAAHCAIRVNCAYWMRTLTESSQSRCSTFSGGSPVRARNTAAWHNAHRRGWGHTGEANELTNEEGMEEADTPIRYHTEAEGDELCASRCSSRFDCAYWKREVPVCSEHPCSARCWTYSSATRLTAGSASKEFRIGWPSPVSCGGLVEEEKAKVNISCPHDGVANGAFWDSTYNGGFSASRDFNVTGYRGEADYWSCQEWCESTGTCTAWEWQLSNSGHTGICRITNTSNYRLIPRSPDQATAAWSRGICSPSSEVTAEREACHNAALLADGMCGGCNPYTDTAPEDTQGFNNTKAFSFSLNHDNLNDLAIKGTVPFNLLSQKPKLYNWYPTFYGIYLDGKNYESCKSKTPKLLCKMGWSLEITKPFAVYQPAEDPFHSFGRRLEAQLETQLEAYPKVKSLLFSTFASPSRDPDHIHPPTAPSSNCSSGQLGSANNQLLSSNTLLSSKATVEFLYSMPDFPAWHRTAFSIQGPKQTDPCENLEGNTLVTSCHQLSQKSNSKSDCVCITRETQTLTEEDTVWNRPSLFASFTIKVEEPCSACSNLVNGVYKTASGEDCSVDECKSPIDRPRIVIEDDARLAFVLEYLPT